MLSRVSDASGVTRVVASASTEGWGRESCRDVVSTAKFARPISRAAPLVRRLKAAFAAPGLQVAVDGKLVWSRVCGYTDVGPDDETAPTAPVQSLPSRDVQIEHQHCSGSDRR